MRMQWMDWTSEKIGLRLSGIRGSQQEADMLNSTLCGMNCLPLTRGSWIVTTTSWRMHPTATMTTFPISLNLHPATHDVMVLLAVHRSAAHCVDRITDDPMPSPMPWCCFLPLSPMTASTSTKRKKSRFNRFLG